MDKIWYRNPSKSEVIGRCGGDEKNEWPRRADKSRMLKNRLILVLITNLLLRPLFIGPKSGLTSQTSLYSIHTRTLNLDVIFYSSGPY